MMSKYLIAAVRRKLALLLVAVAPVAGLAGCGGNAPSAVDTTAAVSRDVTVVTPQRQTIKRTIEQPARIAAYEETPIHVKIPGFVEKVYVEIGQHVKVGEILAELRVPEVLEERTLKAGQVAQARIDITLAEKTFRVAQASLRTAAAMLHEAKASKTKAESQLARWKSESGRMAGLARDKIVGAQDSEEATKQFQMATASLDEAVAKIESAEAALTESEAKRDKAEGEIGAAQNRLLVAAADERRVAALLSYARITSPFDGIVSQRNVHTGHFLQPSSSPTGQAPLFVVVRTDKVRVFLDVPEADAVLVHYGARSGSQARIRVMALNEREFAGNVTGSSWMLDPSQRTLRTEIDFDNPNDELRPGMYAHALIDVEKIDAWTLPSESIQTRDGLTFCYFLEKGKAARTNLKAGVRLGSVTEVLKKQSRPTKAGEKPEWIDFTGQESVITGKVAELTDGQEVRSNRE